VATIELESFSVANQPYGTRSSAECAGARWPIDFYAVERKALFVNASLDIF